MFVCKICTQTNGKKGPPHNTCHNICIRALSIPIIHGWGKEKSGSYEITKMKWFYIKKQNGCSEQRVVGKASVLLFSAIEWICLCIQSDSIIVPTHKTFLYIFFSIINCNQVTICIQNPGNRKLVEQLTKRKSIIHGWLPFKWQFRCLRELVAFFLLKIADYGKSHVAIKPIKINLHFFSLQNEQLGTVVGLLSFIVVLLITTRGKKTIFKQIPISKTSKCYCSH